MKLLLIIYFLFITNATSVVLYLYEEKSNVNFNHNLEPLRKAMNANRANIREILLNEFKQAGLLDDSISVVNRSIQIKSLDEDNFNGEDDEYTWSSKKSDKELSNEYDMRRLSCNLQVGKYIRHYKNEKGSDRFKIYVYIVETYRDKKSLEWTPYPYVRVINNVLSVSFTHSSTIQHMKKVIKELDVEVSDEESNIYENVEVSGQASNLYGTLKTKEEREREKEENRIKRLKEQEEKKIKELEEEVTNIKRGNKINFKPKIRRIVIPEKTEEYFEGAQKGAQKGAQTLGKSIEKLEAGLSGFPSDPIYQSRDALEKSPEDQSIDELKKSEEDQFKAQLDSLEANPMYISIDKK